MRLLFSIIFIFLLHIGYSQQIGFVLTGKVINNQDGNIYLFYRAEDGSQIVDSAEIKYGDFTFKGFINQPVMAFLTKDIQRSRGMDDSNSTTMYLEPGEMTVTLQEGNFKDAKVSGSKTHVEYQWMEKRINKIRNRWQVVFDTLDAANKRDNFEFQELKNWVLVPYNAEVNELEVAFLENYPSSFHSPQVLFFLARELPDDSVRKYYNRFSEKVKDTYFGKEILKDLEKRKIGIPGTVAHDFSTSDIAGKKLSLSDFKGQYVLLDFWASWCLPCRKGNPHLLNLYSNYHKKGFEIIGVASDDRTPDAWKKAVEQDGIGIWKHVLSGFDLEKKMRNEKNELHIGEQYNISTLPTKILIDKNGLIVGRFGESKEDSDTLDKMLQNIFDGL